MIPKPILTAAVVAIVATTLWARPACAQESDDPREGIDRAKLKRDHPLRYQPNELKGSTLHAWIRFLPEWRDWERIQIWVPNDGPERMPCIILFYGGGFGGKHTSGLNKWIMAYLDAGYVVALPDYTLSGQQHYPNTMWDGAAAIRWLRAHAATYRIDPERMAAQGFSAGGWLIQALAPADSTSLIGAENPSNGRADSPPQAFHLLDPHSSVAPEQPVRLQAFASDWQAGRINWLTPLPGETPWWIQQWISKKKPIEHLLRPVLTPDDPPLLTCHNGAPDNLPAAVSRMLALGIPSESAPLPKLKGGLHCPGPTTPSILLDGSEATWVKRHIDFFDRFVKTPTQSTAPEAYPAGQPINEPTAVELRTCHGDGVIHYTLDGSQPTADAAVYTAPITVQPGQTLQAIAIKPGLKPSRAITCEYLAVDVPTPVIKPVGPVFHATVGTPFRLQLECSDPDVRWSMAGRCVGYKPSPDDAEADDRKNKKERELWLDLDPQAGLLSGTPTVATVNVLLISVQHDLPNGRAVVDTRRIGIVVNEADASSKPVDEGKE